MVEVTGRFVRRLRETLGLSVLEMVEKSGFTANHIYRMELGVRAVSPRYEKCLRKLAEEHVKPKKRSRNI